MELTFSMKQKQELTDQLAACGEVQVDCKTQINIKTTSSRQPHSVHSETVRSPQEEETSYIRPQPVQLSKQRS